MRGLYLLGCFLALSFGDPIRHDGHKALRIKADTAEKAAYLHSLGEDVELDVWREVVGEMDVMVSPQKLIELELELNNKELTWTTIVDDVQQLIDQVELPKTPRDFYNYSDFNSLEDIQRELRVLAQDCPYHSVYDDLSCVVVDLSPSTLHGRTIQVLRVRRPGVDRKIVYLDSLTHSREWLGGTTLMRIARDIVRGETQGGINNLAKYDFYFNPVVNPDGYTYTWTGDRTWRKNANPNSNENCTGVDINRNFNYDWGVEPGSSNDSCSNVYRGPSPASERETQAVQGDIMANSQNILTYISIHTAAQMWLTPYGAELSPGVCKMSDTYYDCERTVAQFAAMGTMQEYESVWEFGSVCTTIYPATGITVDFAAGEGITFALTPELRDRDNEGNEYGFYAPPSEIPYAYEETWGGVLSAISQIELLVGFGTCST